MIEDVAQLRVQLKKYSGFPVTRFSRNSPQRKSWLGQPPIEAEDKLNDVLIIERNKLDIEHRARGDRVAAWKKRNDAAKLQWQRALSPGVS